MYVEDRGEALEDRRLKCEGLAKGFMNYLQEHREQVCFYRIQIEPIGRREI